MSLPLNRVLLSRYILFRHIASGGMADIYEANDLVLNRDVALKFLKDKSLTNDYELELFKNEARYASIFNHPHIMKIYNVGEYEGQPFVSYELLKGKTLKEVLDERGKLSFDESLDYMLQILDGVDTLHEREIIHNDLKPDNLFIISDGTIKIVDFGIATHSSSREQKETLGSVNYVAPEILTNKKRSFQSDIFSLGVILFELLTGKTPFEGSTSKEVIDSVIKKNVPSIKSYTNISNYEDFDYIIANATNKNVFNRYKSCKEFMNDLNKIKRHERVKKSGFFSRWFN